MKILLLGEYSNVHATLAKGLRAMGHEVCVVSDGDGWKNYPRDIDLRHSLSLRGTMSFGFRLLKALPRMRGYDIVQIINPMFLPLKAERMMPIYRYLRSHNGRMVMGAHGLDYYWASVNHDMHPMRYSDFNIGDSPRTDAVAMADYHTWVGTAHETLTRAVAADADAIVAGMYEYYVTYMLAAQGSLAHKTTFIPLPIVVPEHIPPRRNSEKVHIFIGISRGRSAYKGTDIMLRAARRIEQLYPDRVTLSVVEGLPFAQYQSAMDESDILLDQLYSYGPAMNALLAMSKGIVVVGGGEPEHYGILNEDVLRPIVNVEPTEDSVFRSLEQIVMHPERLASMRQQSVEYVRRHHDYMSVAARYDSLYRSLL